MAARRGRRVGLSKHEDPPPLLQSLHGRKMNGQLSKSIRNDSSVNLTSCTDEQEDEDFIYGPPISLSDDESSNNGATNQADIKPTAFTMNDKCGLPTGSTEDEESFVSTEPRARKSPLRRSTRESKESTSNSPKKARLETASESGGDGGSIFRFKRTNTNGRALQTYLKKQGTRMTQSNGESSPKATFKKPPKVEVEISRSPEKVLKTFDFSGCSPQVSPEKKIKTFEDLNHLLKSDDDDPVFRTSSAPDHFKEDGSSTNEPTPRIPLRQLENGEDIQSQPHVFRMPSMAADLLSDSQLEVSMASYPENGSFEISPPSPEIATHAFCPMCGESVDANLLKSYNNGKRMNIRTQAVFCRVHKINSARTEWIKKGYPKIDWIDLDARLTEHHSYIKSLLDGAPSHYRDILDEQVRSGKDRTLLQTISSSNTLTPGYYGSRGLRAMSENIMYKFSPQLRKIAVTDRLVAARGVAGYVQHVLVPELAVRLIGEDLRLEIEEARAVMTESMSLGNLLNEEEEDVVVWNEENNVS